MAKKNNTRKELRALFANFPRIAGKTAVDFFVENFNKGGFVNGGLQPWQPAQRENSNGKYAGERYKTLLSARNELMNSITYQANGNEVSISSDKEYAQIHNDGGSINIPVTDKMKKFAWAKHKETNNPMWRGIAMTKKQSLQVNIPQRQFIGYSEELDSELEQYITTEIERIFENQNKK